MVSVLKTESDKQTMELLAPAGSFPAFEAALAEGADSIYVGAPGYNARALSRDFSFAEIGSMIKQAHRQGVKLYIAMNSLVKESEIPGALEALSCFEQLRPDALIIQDLGLLYLAQTWFPALSLHGSTLMSVHNSIAARELTQLGFDRVVLARELTIAEMAAIHYKTDAEIEVFIHGAMCFSYSGLCMFSSLHGGKSSLRGQCVQPCRRHYSWLKSGKTGRGGTKKSHAGYLFSMNDLCGVDVLPALREAGVSCLKIEGRMKSASYVANTVAAYRMALDSLDTSDEEQDRILREAHKLLDAAMARKRSTGYMLSEKPAEAISPEQSGNSGSLLGRIKSMQQVQTRDGKHQLTLQLNLTEQVAVGDRLRLHDELSGERISFTLRNLQVGGRKQKAAQAGQSIQLTLYAKLRGRGNKIFRGSLFKVDVGSRISAERTGQERRKTLSNRKVLPDKRRVEEILGHLCWKRGRVDLDRYPRGKRRGKKGGRDAGRRGGRDELPFWVAISGFADLKGRLPVRAARIIIPLNLANMQRAGQLGGKIKKYQSRLIWRLPPVVNEADVSRYRKHVRKLVYAGYTRFELSHVSQYGLFPLPGEAKQEQPLELYAHYTLNLLNSAALQAAKHLHLQGVLFSLETEGENLAAAIAHFKRQGGRGSSKQSMKTGCYVYGRPPLFTARLDSDHYMYQHTFMSPKEEEFTLKQQDGFTFAHSVLPFSLLKWRSELAVMGVDYLVIDLTGGPLRKEVETVSTLLGSGGRRVPVLSGNFQGTLV